MEFEKKESEKEKNGFVVKKIATSEHHFTKTLIESRAWRELLFYRKKKRF